MKNIRNTAIAGLAAIAFVAAGAVANPSQAQAGDLGKAIVGGFIAGAFIGAATSHAYGAPVYHSNCHYKSEFQGYNAYGQPIYQQVKYCY